MTDTPTATPEPGYHFAEAERLLAEAGTAQDGAGGDEIQTMHAALLTHRAQVHMGLAQIELGQGGVRQAERLADAASRAADADGDLHAAVKAHLATLDEIPLPDGAIEHRSVMRLRELVR